MPRSRVLTTLLVALLLTGVATGVSQARQAPLGQDLLVPGQVYAGDFPDPSVLRVGDTFYAYSTTSDGVNVPTLTSADLRTWRAAPATATNPSGDALPRTPVWSAGSAVSDGRFVATTWAPSVIRLGPGRYVLAYATQVGGAPGQKMCISVATGSRPLGPFVDTSTGPVVCPAQGAIDPQIVVAPTGRPRLIWKADHYPARLMSTPMNLAATAVLTTPGSNHVLARVRQPWEGSIIENPAMIRFHGRLYLFYSANSYASTRYAIGYLICKNLSGDCRRPLKHPLLATGGDIAGPGGPSPFLDRLGRLRLAYHAWRAGAVGYPTSTRCLGAALGCPQRRLHLAILRAARTGDLAVVARQ
ncbi:MAG: glycoside hydrolase, family 43 [Marmoricola sp.]|nr:glycoside hydrolase, family 43 [Marmoricola sp.]